MSKAVVKEIPDGAEITVTLKNGKSFTGNEASTKEHFEDGILRLERKVDKDDPDGDVIVFVADHEDVSCYEMHNQR